MRNITKRFLNTYFGEDIALGAQVFHLLGFSGVLLGLVNALGEALNELRFWHFVLNLAASLFAMAMIRFARKTGRYRVCSVITVISVFIIVFPVLFFTGDGYGGTLPMFFLLAFVFTALMLDGGLKAGFLAAELIVYASCMFVEHRVFGQLANYGSNFENMIEVLIGFVCVGFALMLLVTLHLRLYNRQKRKLDEQNAALAEANRAKTEFLQDIGHEIRNPLQVITYGIDFMRDSIGEGSGTEEMLGALNVIQDKAVRLGLMVNGMVELATMGGSPANREKIDFSAMLRQSAETARLEAERKRNVIRVEIAPGLPQVFAVSEQLERVPMNLLQNAMNATEGGEISLSAALAGGYISVRIEDSGKGMAPELLSRVFERGVSGGGGKGYGLSICKTIVEAHGGTIGIESEAGKGTAVTFTVPVYGGQSEAMA